MKASLSTIVCLCLAVLTVTGCTSFQLGQERHGAIHIKTFIDGSDTLKIRGNEIWYEHHKWDLPGRWGGRFDEPTYVNGDAWQPQWSGTVSKPYTELKPVLPSREIDLIQLTKQEGRGSVTVAEKPNKDNDYTLSLYFDDNSYDGAQWYEISVEW